MLEDFTISMEKKPTRTGQGQGKTNGTESKKNQDAVGGKPYPRTRRRESTQSSSSSGKSEPSRKPNPQKNKAIDKRPRPRGQYYGGGKEDSKVTSEEVAEYGSVFVPGSKKQNLNHLLNFHYAPRGSMASQGPKTSSSWGRSQRWLPNTHKHKYNKEHFLQANCQFVVKYDGDYSAYISNPDTLVDWNLIEQIRVQSGETLYCPICLCVPVAGKMTRCGHVFCWPCILHYLALSDKTWRACPICYESVHKMDLKSVVAVQHKQVAVGDEVTLFLMRRERGSMVATPMSQCDIRPTNQLLSVSETAVDIIYSKLLTATLEEVQCMIASEQCELETQMKEEQGCPELCFTEQALELLSQRRVKLDNEKCKNHVKTSTEPVTLSREIPKVEPGILSAQLDCNHPVLFYDSAFDNKIADGEVPSVAAIHCEENQLLSTSAPVNEDWLHTNHDAMMPGEEQDTFDMQGVAPLGETRSRPRYESASSSEGGPTAITAEDLEIHHPTIPQKHFYFYQASDGQHMYLHALNVRMLEMQYGSLANCPAVIVGRVVEKEAGSMTEELRKRLRYLQHLSVTCQFEVAEIELRPPIINQDILCHFQEQLEVRRRRRISRAKQELRREKKINDEENRKWGRGPAPRVHIQSTKHFPQWGAEGLIPAMAPSSSLSGVSSPSLTSLASRDSSPRAGVESPITTAFIDTLDRAVDALDISQQHGEQPGGPSFAQMLRDGKSRPGIEWPVPSDRPKIATRETRASDSEPEPEGYVPAPTFSQSFSAAIALALEKAEAEQLSGVDVQVSGKKKKNKSKKKILFATSMACSGK